MPHAMPIDARAVQGLIVAVSTDLIRHADELTSLDRAIGDGDHGVNLRRGFEAVRDRADAIASKPLAEALQAIGTELLLTVGGASGPLYGTLFMALGREIGAALDLGTLIHAFAHAVDAVMSRGRSGPGHKTLLDVLVPVREELRRGGGDLCRRLPVVAARAAEATVAMQARRGRAAFLGPRSVGHMDPGASSSSRMVAAVCRAWEA